MVSSGAIQFRSGHALTVTPRPSVKVWYPAIVARYKGRIVGARQYYHDLGLDSSLNPSNWPANATDIPQDHPVVDAAPSESKFKTLDKLMPVGGGSGLPIQKEKYTPNALGKSRIGRFQRPMGVRSIKKYNAGFDDCERALQPPRDG